MIQVICCSSLLSVPGRAGAFSRDFTTSLAPECRTFHGALKIEKLKAPLIPGPKSRWIQMTGALKIVLQFRGLSQDSLYPRLVNSKVGSKKQNTV